jgi:hypothetical protein
MGQLPEVLTLIAWISRSMKIGGRAHEFCKREIMRTGCDVHHGFGEGTDGRGAGLRGGRRVGCRGVGGGGRDLSVRLRRRRHGSQHTGMVERVKPRSREAVRHLPQGFTRDDSPGEDECGVLGVWVEWGMARW